MFQGTRKALNSIFSNFHRLVTGWPDGHTFKHLKQQVLEKLVNEHDEMFDKLAIHLQKSKLSYAQIVEAIRTCDNQEPILDNTGEFIMFIVVSEQFVQRFNSTAILEDDSYCVQFVVIALCQGRNNVCQKEHICVLKEMFIFKNN